MNDIMGTVNTLLAMPIVAGPLGFAVAVGVAVLTVRGLIWALSR